VIEILAFTGAAHAMLVSPVRECVPKPVSVRVQMLEQGVTLEVVGASPRPLNVEYEFVVSGGQGNKVRQASRAVLQPGPLQVLTTVRLGSSVYDAQLTVHCGGTKYIQNLRSAA
jgi:hypothetical protein